MSALLTVGSSCGLGTSAPVPLLPRRRSVVPLVARTPPLGEAFAAVRERPGTTPGRLGSPGRARGRDPRRSASGRAVMAQGRCRRRGRRRRGAGRLQDVDDVLVLPRGNAAAVEQDACERECLLRRGLPSRSGRLCRRLLQGARQRTVSGQPSVGERSGECRDGRAFGVSRLRIRSCQRLGPHVVLCRVTRPALWVGCHSTAAQRA